MIKTLTNKIFILASIIFLAAIGFYIYARIISQEPVVKGEKSYIVKKQTLKETLSLSGEVEAQEKVTLRFQSSGLLNWVGVKEGDYVKKYQGVASQDPKELEKNLKKYLNSYLESRWDFETSKDTYESTIGGLSGDAKDEAKRVFEKAQFDLNNAVLDVELKDIALKYAYLYTPIEGIVTRVASPYSGVYVTATQAEFDVVNPKTIFFSATADQTDVVKLKDNMNGIIIFDSYPENTIAGKIKSISFLPKAGETGTVYEVKITFPQSSQLAKYRLGMTGDVEFEIGAGRQAVVIPTSFIKTEKEEKIVLKLVNGKKIKTIIKTGDAEDSITEVTSGLNEGDTIVN